MVEREFFISFIDDYSRKLEFTSCKKCQKLLQKKKVGKPIKILRIDRGGEYNSQFVF